MSGCEKGFSHQRKLSHRRKLSHQRKGGLGAMFERRLRILLVLLALPVAAIALRLVHLQVVNASDYREEAAGLLLKDVVYDPCLRGEIVDHEVRAIDLGRNIGIVGSSTA